MVSIEPKANCAITGINTTVGGLLKGLYRHHIMPLSCTYKIILCCNMTWQESPPEFISLKCSCICSSIVYMVEGLVGAGKVLSKNSMGSSFVKVNKN